MPIRKILLLLDSIILGGLMLVLIYFINIMEFSTFIYLFYSTVYVIITIIANIITDFFFFKSKLPQIKYRIIFIAFFTTLLGSIILLSSINNIYKLNINYILYIIIMLFWVIPIPTAFILSFWQYRSIKIETEINK
jgi:hypothetical protein